MRARGLTFSSIYFFCDIETLEVEFSAYGRQTRAVHGTHQGFPLSLPLSPFHNPAPLKTHVKDSSRSVQKKHINRQDQTLFLEQDLEVAKWPHYLRGHIQVELRADRI